MPNKYINTSGRCTENCSSCSDELCIFHEKNFNKHTYIELKKMIEEKVKNMPAS